MRRALADGFELDDDRERVDVAAVHRYLAEESYWARGRPYEFVERSVRQASRVIGLYDGERLIGFARVASDEVAFAYLADVYVLSEYRGRGLGSELVREAVLRGPHAHLRWFLRTTDAHAFYERFGFGPASQATMERERPR